MYYLPLIHTHLNMLGALVPCVFGLLRCVPVYQRSSVQILTQFTAQDSQSRTIHLLSSSDWFVDVTQLVRDWMRVEDPRVASLGPQNNLIGLRPGKTSLHVGDTYWTPNSHYLQSCFLVPMVTWKPFLSTIMEDVSLPLLLF